MTFDRKVNETGFLLSFPADGTPRPRYLGRSFSQKSYNDLLEHVPPPAEMVKGEETLAGPGDDRSHEAWVCKMDMATNEIRRKQRESKAKRAEKRFIKRSGK